MDTVARLRAAQHHRNRLYGQHQWRLAERWQTVFVRLVIQANREEAARIGQEA